MNISVDYTLDKANKLLICEASGVAEQVNELEYLLKNTVKMAGKNQVKNVALDVTEFVIKCSNIELTRFLKSIQEQGWLSDMKVARIVKTEQNIQNVIAGLAEKFNLPIKNFETRSEAMLWLLFDKLSDSEL